MSAPRVERLPAAPEPDIPLNVSYAGAGQIMSADALSPRRPEPPPLPVLPEALPLTQSDTRRALLNARTNLTTASAMYNHMREIEVLREDVRSLPKKDPRRPQLTSQLNEAYTKLATMRLQKNQPEYLLEHAEQILERIAPKKKENNLQRKISIDLTREHLAESLQTLRSSYEHRAQRIQESKGVINGALTGASSATVGVLSGSYVAGLLGATTVTGIAAGLGAGTLGAAAAEYAPRKLADILTLGYKGKINTGIQYAGKAAVIAGLTLVPGVGTTMAVGAGLGALGGVAGNAWNRIRGKRG